MPRGHRARAADEPEMMDMEEPAAPEPVEPVVEPERATEHDEKKKKKSMKKRSRSEPQIL
jgi:hypothetical protein